LVPASWLPLAPPLVKPALRSLAGPDPEITVAPLSAPSTESSGAVVGLALSVTTKVGALVAGAAVVRMVLVDATTAGGTVVVCVETRVWATGAATVCVSTVVASGVVVAFDDRTI
jgi:hypothetical protein